MKKGKHLKPFWRSVNLHKIFLKRKKDKVNDPLKCSFCEKKINLNKLKHEELKFGE